MALFSSNKHHSKNSHLGIANKQYLFCGDFRQFRELLTPIKKSKTLSKKENMRNYYCCCLLLQLTLTIYPRLYTLKKITTTIIAQQQTSCEIYKKNTFNLQWSKMSVYAFRWRPITKQIEQFIFY